MSFFYKAIDLSIKSPKILEFDLRLNQSKQTEQDISILTTACRQFMEMKIGLSKLLNGKMVV